MELRIDPEFRDKIPPLTDAEYEQLRDNIIEDGEVYEPIAVWNGIIVDGHNRWKIVQEHPEITYKVREMDFPDKWAAFEWMYRKQLGRRNLSDEQKTYMIGKMYEARKQTQGGDHGNQYTVANGQNVHLPNGRRVTRDGTSGDIGKEFGIDGRSVRRAEAFAKGLDAMREESPEAADKVLAGGTGVTKASVRSYPQMDKDKQKELTDSIVMGKPIKVSAQKKAQKVNADIERIDNEARDTEKEIPYTVDDLCDQLRSISEMMVSQYRQVLRFHSDVLNEEGARDRVAVALNNSMSAIGQLRKLVKDDGVGSV